MSALPMSGPEGSGLQMVNTEFFDQPKPDKLQPEDVANAVMQAISAPSHVAIHEIFLMPNN